MWLKTEALELINLDKIAKIAITYGDKGKSLVLSVMYIDASAAIILSNVPTVEAAQQIISYIYDAINQNVRILDVAMILPILQRK